MLPSDASALQAIVMRDKRCSQQQAQEWLDKWVPHWRTEEPNEPVRISEQLGDDDE
ncbi:TPA: hypothetical protein ACGU7D_004264 [Vibrio vulnificus]